MQPTPDLQLSAAVNGQFPVNRLTNFTAAVVVINSLPFRGRIDRLPPSHPHRIHPLPTARARSRPAGFGYVVAEPLESINRAKRHELTTAQLRVSPTGGADVLHQ
jgi:hypothetical protein